MDLLWSIHDKLSGGSGLSIDRPNHQWAFEIAEDVVEDIQRNLKSNAS